MYFRYITSAKKLYKKRTYTNAFESAGIGHFKLYWFKTYTNAFENAGIGLLNYIDLRPIPALFRTLE